MIHRIIHAGKTEQEDVKRAWRIVWRHRQFRHQPFHRPGIPVPAAAGLEVRRSFKVAGLKTNIGASSFHTVSGSVEETGCYLTPGAVEASTLHDKPGRAGDFLRSK